MLENVDFCLDLILQNGEVFKMNQREHLRDKKIIHDSSFEMIETKISHNVIIFN